MDYEFRIRQAELQLSHLQAMQQFQRDRGDAHEKSIDSLHTLAQRTTENLDVLTVQVGKLETQVGKLEVKIDQLVDALLHGRNGGASGKA